MVLYLPGDFITYNKWILQVSTREWFLRIPSKSLRNWKLVWGLTLEYSDFKKSHVCEGAYTHTQAHTNTICAQIEHDGWNSFTEVEI